MKKRYCPLESDPATTSGASLDRYDAADEASVERAAALMGHDAIVAQAEGELAAVLLRKGTRRR
jgi:hypothetical protein